MKEIELKEKRKLKEKHFLREDGTIVAKVFSENVHYFKDGKYEDIDNSLNETGDEFINKENSFKSRFKKNIDDGLLKVEKDEFYIDFNLSKKNKIKKKKINVIKDKHVIYTDLFNSISFEYQLFNSKIKESIILKDNKYNIEDLIFDIDTNLKLEIKDDNIYCLKDEKIIFIIDKPFMVDKCGARCDDIKYILFEKNNKYQLIFDVDEEWLNSNDRVFPIIIDPTITEFSNDNSVQDTYIYQGDTEVTRYNLDNFKVGLEDAIVNRALIKFALPSIGTSSQIISAKMHLFGYPIDEDSYDSEILNVHAVNIHWDVATATWEDMFDKFDNYVESSFEATRSFGISSQLYRIASSVADITLLVKRWYDGLENNGLMIKSNNETKSAKYLSTFFSGENNVESTNLKPVLEVVYRDQNGIVPYMNYLSNDTINGTVFTNICNGNLTYVNNILTTQGNNSSLLSIIYNTNDVILEHNYNLGIGFKFNLFQYIDDTDSEYIKYLDATSNVHYFIDFREYFNADGEILIEEEEDVFYDEDGLGLKLYKYDLFYILKDKKNYKYKFEKINANNVYYLTEIIDKNNFISKILYDENNRIVKIIDCSDFSIDLQYFENEIYITNSKKTVVLFFYNNNLISINDSVLGEICFSYNNNLLEQIVDVDGKKIAFEFYSTIPFRIKQVLLYGKYNSIENRFSFLYNFMSTRISNNNLDKIYVFNQHGALKSINNVCFNNEVTEMFGESIVYGQYYQELNKILNTTIPIKYTKNFIKNSNFYLTDLTEFIFDDGLSGEVTAEESNFGNNSLKLISTSINSSASFLKNVTKGSYYTFSVYIKNNVNVRIKLSYINSNNETIQSESKTINIKNEFVRYDVSIYYPVDALSQLKIEFILEDIGFIFVDNLQLEKGKVSNRYNFVNNSDFEDGLYDWDVFAYYIDENLDEEINTDDVFEVVTLSDDKTALKIKMSPEYESNVLKEFNIDGKKGDIYRISFWYKNEGIINPEDDYCNNVTISFSYISEEIEDGYFAYPSLSLNPNRGEWQYFSEVFCADYDYDNISLVFFEKCNANSLYITNISIEKEFINKTYQYDEIGNVSKITHYNKESTLYDYDESNKVVNILKRNGKSNYIEYLYEKSNLPMSGVLSSNLSVNYTYDSFGNIISKIVSPKKCVQLLANGIYDIRLNGCNKFLGIISMMIKPIESKYIKTQWKLESVTIVENEISIIEDENGENVEIKNENEIEYFKISNVIMKNMFLYKLNNSLSLSNETSLFKLVKNNDNSYCILEKESGLYLCVQNNEFIFSEYNNFDNFKFYFDVSSDNIFLQEEFNYSSDGRYLLEIEDSTLNKKYSYYDENEMVNEIFYPNDKKIKLYYNEKNQILEINSNNSSIIFAYDGLKLKDINYLDNKFTFVYDDFNNLIAIYVNDIKIYSISIENNLISYSRFGVGDGILYYYNDFNKLVKIIKNSLEYNFEYDNSGNIREILYENNSIDYEYDIFNRLKMYKFDNFKVLYNYNESCEVVGRNYFLNNYSNNVTYVEDVDRDIILYDAMELYYYYDKLKRICDININGNLNVKYKYIHNGKRESMLPCFISNNNYEIKYKYNKDNNIKYKYYNDNLMASYKYNLNGELIEENNYMKNYKAVFKYDLYGNMLKKYYYNLSDFSLISVDSFEYNDNRYACIISKYNNNEISTDSLGNLVSIENDCSLTWYEDLRQLKTFTSNNLDVKFKYDINDLRISKNVNGKITKYYYEKDKLIYQVTDDQIIYFMYDYSGDLIGFKYNNTNYLYVKNLEDDILGIMDLDGNMIAQYEYDAWGNILGIIDNLGCDLKNQTDHIANINPFRYRSYYYDSETNLYYLVKRYYSPKLCRFISIDSKFSKIATNTNYYNLFLYCNNNPVNCYDENGTSIKDWISKQTKKLKNGISKAWNGITNTVSDGWNYVKKSVIKTKKVINNTVEKVKESWQWIKEHFIIEFGYGFGIDSPLENGSVYSDATWGIKNGSSFSGTEVSAYGNTGDNLFNYEGGYELSHDTHLAADYDHHTNQWNIIGIGLMFDDCEEISSGFYTSVGNDFFTIKNNGDVFIGIDFDFHCILGGHIKIGFEENISY